MAKFTMVSVLLLCLGIAFSTSSVVGRRLPNSSECLNVVDSIDWTKMPTWYKETDATNVGKAAVQQMLRDWCTNPHKAIGDMTKTLGDAKSFMLAAGTGSTTLSRQIAPQDCKKACQAGCTGAGTGAIAACAVANVVPVFGQVAFGACTAAAAGTTAVCLSGCEQCP